ncbi:DNA replication complex GINS family protein [Thermococcus sp. ES12]|uniref:DNA replication complex GINS family protein n=1 Tax=Thermococcus sp. ES12 TaxID=1638246 RepID=UPI0014304425|nr:DNA replication complex GINS family protein [Thermococcus sp. ES12]NJE75958.1 DNA replication complex GINS family protein [Thermococcus sp. ES12]
MSEPFVPVKFLVSVGDYKEGMMYLIEPEVAKVLWTVGAVEVIDEIGKMVGEVDRAVMEEKESEPLTELPKNLYERAEFWIWYTEEYIRRNSRRAPVDDINVRLAKLANLKKKLRTLRAIRLRKILTTAMLRPHSDGILARLTPEEAEVYEYLSTVVERWLG